MTFVIFDMYFIDWMKIITYLLIKTWSRFPSRKKKQCRFSFFLFLKMPVFFVVLSFRYSFVIFHNGDYPLHIPALSCSY